MLLAIIQRIWQMFFVMFGISVLVFLIFFATPGADPASRIAGRGASPEILDAVRKSFGLDQPFFIQYLTMMKKIFITGDLTSFVNRGWKVVPAVMDTIPVTMSRSQCLSTSQKLPELNCLATPASCKFDRRPTCHRTIIHCCRGLR